MQSAKYFIIIMTFAGFTYMTIVTLAPPTTGTRNVKAPDSCLPLAVFDGLVIPNTTAYSGNITVVEDIFPDVINGTWEPYVCNQTEHIAIIVPYRNRSKQLPIFLEHINKFLQRQLRNYKIFLVEQTDSQPFNRGSLFNVGFLEAEKMDKFDCYILHDVDLLPENDELIYTCQQGYVGHYAELISKLNYTRIYAECAGGVVSFATEDFRYIDGYSNVYWGWGAEDDDLYLRIIIHRLIFEHQSDSHGRYTSLSHNHQALNKQRFRMLKQAKRRLGKDGLSNIIYNVKKVEVRQLFVHILVDLSDLRTLVRKTWKV